MRLYRSLPVMLFAGALASVVCIAQAAPQSTTASEPPAQATANAGLIDPCPVISATDQSLALVSKLCEFALAYRHRLPDFIVEQKTTSTDSASAFVMTAQVTFHDGREEYSRISVNGEPVSSATTATALPRGVRFSSSGELGSLLVDLFTYPRAAEFKFQKNVTLRGVPVALYEFHLPAAKNTFWKVRESNGKSLRLDFRGQLWLDRETGYPLREEVGPVHFPGNSEFVSARTSVNYAMIDIGDAGKFLLPTRSETSVCSSGLDVLCNRNVLVFHNYRKFGATARILSSEKQP